jgi:hypothetical protein
VDDLGVVTDITLAVRMASGTLRVDGSLAAG